MATCYFRVNLCYFLTSLFEIHNAVIPQNTVLCVKECYIYASEPISLANIILQLTYICNSHKQCLWSRDNPEWPKFRQIATDIDLCLNLLCACMSQQKVITCKVAYPYTEVYLVIPSVLLYVILSMNFAAVLQHFTFVIWKQSSQTFRSAISLCLASCTLP